MPSKEELEFMTSMYSFPVGASLLNSGEGPHAKSADDAWERAARKADEDLKYSMMLLQVGMMERKWKQEVEVLSHTNKFMRWFKKYVW